MLLAGATAYPDTLGLTRTDALHPVAATNEMASKIQKNHEYLLCSLGNPSVVLSLHLVRTGHLSCA
jgi:hypothetical protein